MKRQCELVSAPERVCVIHANCPRRLFGISVMHLTVQASPLFPTLSFYKYCAVERLKVSIFSHDVLRDKWFKLELSCPNLSTSEKGLYYLKHIVILKYFTPYQEYMHLFIPVSLPIKKPDKNLNISASLTGSVAWLWWLLCGCLSIVPLSDMCHAPCACAPRLNAASPERLSWMLSTVKPRALCVQGEHSNAGLCPQLFPSKFCI